MGKQKIASAEQMISVAAEVILSDAAAKEQQRAIAAAAIAVKEAAKAAATRLRGAASQSAAERVEEASFASEQAEDYLCEKLFNRKQLTAVNLPHADLDGPHLEKYGAKIPGILSIFPIRSLLALSSTVKLLNNLQDCMKASALPNYDAMVQTTGERLLFVNYTVFWQFF